MLSCVQPAIGTRYVHMPEICYGVWYKVDGYSDSRSNPIIAP